MVGMWREEVGREGRGFVCWFYYWFKGRRGVRGVVRERRV